MPDMELFYHFVSFYSNITLFYIKIRNINGKVLTYQKKGGILGTAHKYLQYILSRTHLGIYV